MNYTGPYIFRATRHTDLVNWAISGNKGYLRIEVRRTEGGVRVRKHTNLNLYLSILINLLHKYTIYISIRRNKNEVSVCNYCFSQ